MHGAADMQYACSMLHAPPTPVLSQEFLHYRVVHMLVEMNSRNIAPAVAQEPNKLQDNLITLGRAPSLWRAVTSLTDKAPHAPIPE